MAESIKEIESNFDLDEIKIDNFHLWPIIKFPYFVHLSKKVTESKKKPFGKIFFDLFYGFSNWFGRYDAFFVTESSDSSKRNRVAAAIP